MTLPKIFNEPYAPHGGRIGQVMEPGAEVRERDRLDFRGFITILRRRLRILLTIVALFLALGILVSMLQQKIYDASAFVLLKSSGEKLEERVTERPEQQGMVGDADVSTEIQVIGSLDLSQRVVRNLKLVENPAFNPLLVRQTSLFGDTREPVNLATLTPEQRSKVENQVIQNVRRGLGAERLGTAYAVRIGYRSSDPEIAAQLANAFAEEYVQWQVAQKKEATLEATEFLASKVAELRQQATADFGAVQKYRVQNGLLSNAATGLAEQDISVYNQQSATARAEAAADAARLSTARRQLEGGSNGEDVGEALSSSVVSSLRTQRAQIATRVADLSARYGARHPDLIRAREELAEIDRQIQAEIDRVISNLEAKTEVSRGRLASIESSLGAAKSVLGRNNNALVTLDDLQRRADASKGLYESYLSRYQQVMAGSGTEQPEAKIVASAFPPPAPSSPNIPLNLILAGLCGVLFGVIAAMAAEMQYKGLTTAEDVETRVGLPYLGLTPESSTLENHAASPIETLIEQPDSLLAEAVRAIHSATHLPSNGRARVIAVSSAVPGEGKTVLSAMLGLTAAASGANVVVIDCDILLRGLSRLASASDGPGLREITSGSATIDDAIRQWDGSSLKFVPITSQPEPGERLTSNGAIHAVIGQLKERFDLIVLDCPPLLAITEAREIAALADGVVLAVHWRKTSSDAVRAAARLLPARLAAYTGVVLSRVDMRKQRRYANDETTTYATAYQRYLVAAA